MKKTPPLSARRGPARRGAALLIVLALIAMTLALSYAMVRTQTMSSEVQLNYNRRARARDAAFAGLSLAMRKMSDPSWAGVGVDLTGNLGEGMSYAVQFATGDAALTPTHPDYAEYPYRVTISSTGTAHDPADASRQATHKVEAVVQLVRRKLADPPASWSGLQPYTVYQWADRRVNIELPCRIEGPVFFQDEIALCEDYPNDADDKPFAGTIDEVVLLRSALTTQQIQDLQAGVITLDELLGENLSSPLARWQLNESAGAQIAADQLGIYHGRYDGAAAGAAARSADSGQAAARFDGFNDEIYLGSIDVPGPTLTILAWFKVDNFDTSDGRIISKTTGSSSGEHYWMLSTIAASGDHRLRFRLKTTDGGTTTLIAGSGNLPVGEWVFAAAVYNGAQMQLYKDGALVGQTNKTGLIEVNPFVYAAIGNNPPGSPRSRMLRDLVAMQNAQGGDERPLSGPVHTPRTRQSEECLSLLEDDLQLSVVDEPPASGAPVTHPGQVTSYQLYPGGKLYYATPLDNSLSNVQLGPDPQSNPLGLFTHATELRLYDGVSIDGTVITYDGGSRGDIEIHGQGVQLRAVDLPPLAGDSQVYQLPAAIARDDLRVYAFASGSLDGMAVTWDDFEAVSDANVPTFDVRGRLVIGELELFGRQQWDRSSDWWKARGLEFLNSIGLSLTPAYFPEWLTETEGLNRTPRVHIRPDERGVAYHWQDWSQPVFVPHPDDGGLRWDLIDWRDNP